MRTNLRTTNLLQLCFIVLIIALFGCKSEDPDPRQTFASEFEMDDFDVLLDVGVDDSTFSLTSNPQIEFEIDGDLDPDEMRMEIEEFLDDIFQDILGNLITASVSLDFDDDAVVEISGNEFELDDYEFTLILSDGGSTDEYDCEVSVQGELDGDEITLEFEITLYTGSTNNYVFSGTAIGERQ